MVEITIIIFYIVSDGSATSPLLEDHSEGMYQKELDRMNSNAGMVELKEVNDSVTEKEEEQKDKFLTQEDVQNMSATNHVNESKQTACRKL